MGWIVNTEEHHGGHEGKTVDATMGWAMYQNFAGKLREVFREHLPPPFARPRNG
jgi:hypothetical protein